MDPNDARNPESSENDVSGDAPTMPELPQASGMPAAGQDRRTFLKAAVVASAAVAAAGGAAGAALISGRQPAPLIKFVGNANSGDPCDACIEGTQYTASPYYYCTANNNNNPPTYSSTTTNCSPTPPASPTLSTGFTMNKNGTNNADFQLFFVDHAPASGTISLTITVYGKTDSTGSNIDNTAGKDIDNSDLFGYNTSNGNAVWITEQTNIPAAPCMSDQSTNLSTFVTNLGSSPSSTLHGAGLGTVGGLGLVAQTLSYSPCSTGCHQTGSATDDILVQLHMSWKGGKISGTATQELYTFKFAWTDGTTTCTKYLYIYGVQS